MDGVDAMRRDEVVSFQSQVLAAQITVTAISGRPMVIRAADILAVGDLGEDVQPLGVEPLCEVFFGAHSVVVRDTQAAVLALLDAAISPAPITSVYVEDQKISGTDGGTATVGSFATRDLNTVVSDPGSLVVSLAANQVELLAGTYLISAHVPGFQVNGYQARLQNITAGTTALVGSTERSEPIGATNVQTAGVIAGRVVTAVTTKFEVQMQVETTTGSEDFGQAKGFAGTPEVYTQILFQAVTE